MKAYARIYEAQVAELFATDGDITEMFHPDLVWAEVTDITPQPDVGWTALQSGEGGIFSAPVVVVPTTDELKAAALAQRDALLVEATLRIAPLQFAVDLEEATTDESASLKLWKQYSVALNRIATQAGYPQAIDWPVAPSA